MRTPHRSPERDAAIMALLPRVPEYGWSQRALEAALGDIGQDPATAQPLFPDGAIEMIETACDLTDRRMAEAAEALDLPSMRISQRVRVLIVLRLQLNRSHKEAIRRAMAVLALPGNAVRASCITGRTADAIWRAAGDQSDDFSWYSKRVILAGVYATTQLFWLRDTSADEAETLAFLDRRLANTALIGKVRKKIEGIFARFKAA